jgi:hypothetical protein
MLRLCRDHSRYCEAMGETEGGADRDAISQFLASPARHYDEDVELATSPEDDAASRKPSAAPASFYV